MGNRYELVVRASSVLVDGVFRPREIGGGQKAACHLLDKAMAA